MRGLVVLSVLAVWALPCTSVPTKDTSGRHWTCDENEKEPGARLAMLSINNKHFHGYKFQLSNITSSTVEKAESDCKLHLELDLQETTCHIVNPKSFEECDIRPQHQTQVKAHCNVTLSITEGIAEVSKHSCDTEPVSAEKMVRMCPDCPTLLPLHSPEGLESVKAGLRQFNMEHNYTSYFKLMEVGRITSGYMMMTGMNYYAEFAIMETECNAKSRIDTKACKPMCPDEARHGLCKSTLLGNGIVDVDCEIYEALNTNSPHTHGRECGPPIHPGIKHHLPPWLHRQPTGNPGPLPGFPGRPGGPPPGGEGPPPGPHNPPPGPHGEFPFPHCHGFVKIPPSIHPLCAFPPPHHSHHHPHPRPHGHGPPPGHSLPPHSPHILGMGPPPHVKA